MRIHFVISILLFLSHSVCVASSDSCGENTEFQYERWDYGNCSSDLNFLDLRNDSRGIQEMLFDIYLKPEIESQIQKSEKADSTTTATEVKQVLVEIGFKEELLNNENQDSSNPEISTADFNSLTSYNNNYELASVRFLREVNKLDSKEEKNALISRRLELIKSPKKEYEFLKENNLNKTDFQKYHVGATAFYNLKFEEAILIFCGLSETTTGWVKESSLYTCARAQLLYSQDKWDGYSSPDSLNINTELVSRAKETFLRYIEAYPSGLYEESAKGLLRKASYIGGDWKSYFKDMAIAF